MRAGEWHRVNGKLQRRTKAVVKPAEGNFKFDTKIPSLVVLVMQDVLEQAEAVGADLKLRPETMYFRVPLEQIKNMQTMLRQHGIEPMEPKGI